MIGDSQYLFAMEVVKFYPGGECSVNQAAFIYPETI